MLVYSLQERGNSYELDSHASDRPFRAFTQSFLAMRALFRHASFTRICDCRIFRIFQQSTHISYLFRINWLFDGNSTIFTFVFCYILVSLPRPSGCQQNGTIMTVRTPVERDRILVSSNYVPYFRRIFGVCVIRIF